MIIIICAALWALLVVGAILFVRHAIAEDRRDFDREDDCPPGPHFCSYFHPEQRP